MASKTGPTWKRLRFQIPFSSGTRGSAWHQSGQVGPVIKCSTSSVCAKEHVRTRSVPWDRCTDLLGFCTAGNKLRRETASGEEVLGVLAKEKSYPSKDSSRQIQPVRSFETSHGWQGTGYAESSAPVDQSQKTPYPFSQF